MLVVKFKDYEGWVHYGIRLDKDTIMCGCCGGTFEMEDVEILATYPCNLDVILKEKFGE